MKTGIGKIAHELLIKGTLKNKKYVEPSSVDRSLRAATIEGACNGSSNTIINSYTTAFALSLGASNIQIGLLTSMKSLAETLAQIPGSTLTKYFSRKAIWTYATMMSKLLWLPILFLPMLGNNILLLIALVAASHFFVSMRTASWTSLIGEIVPPERRGSYFGRRNMIIGISGLATVLIAGNLIPLLGFEFIFAASIVLGIAAIYFFRPIYEAPFQKAYHYSHSISFSPSDLLKAVRINRNFVLLTLFLSLMSFSTNIAAPFFVVYELRDLGIGYGWFTIAIAINAIVALISQPYWGRLSDKYGEKKILAVTGILAALVPFVWLFVYSPVAVVLAESFSGFAWAGFDMVAFNFVLAATPAEKRTSYVANHTFFRGIAVVGGTLAGGMIAQNIVHSTFLWLGGLQLLFLISLVLRLLSLSLITKVRDAAFRDDTSSVRYILWQAVAVEPAKGISHAIQYASQYPYPIEQLKRKIEKMKAK